MLCRKICYAVFYRVELYLSKETSAGLAKGVAQRAVIRNVTKALAGQPGKRLVIADNFYSSCALVLTLLEKGYYYVGTHRSDRLGWPRSVQFPQKTRPKGMPRGAYRIAHAKEVPGLVAVAWMDSRPVNMIASGCATTQTTVLRRDKGRSERSVVPCPQLLFLAFVDMAIVNAFILHKEVLQKKGEKVPTRAEYMRRLHVELLNVSKVTLWSNINAEDLVTVPTPAGDHTLVNTDDMYEGGRDAKRRQHLCKVCSAMAAIKTKSYESSYYCPTCTELRGGYVPLCNRVRREASGNTLTCSQIWHQSWANGTAIPPHFRQIRFRERKRKRRDAEEK
ncbi:Hypothetical protein PHPALM_5007 [Phytophthora palmivora]|uniref:PiggyBac transposable element-derived protein domain-containing protein n=1 Tax=Phytophthora palmivora TaxID=4796 RepID=A0A2P4YIF8_9STRA|nr:Hypothetical protein PHPALM_5007 [Phytophthora palmivora]